MSRLSKAWSSPPPPVSGPAPVSGPSLVTQALIRTISAQTFRMATTPRYAHLPAKKDTSVAFEPHIFTPVTLHGVVVNFDPKALARLYDEREKVKAQIASALGSRLRKIKNVPVGDIVHALSRSRYHRISGHVQAVMHTADDEKLNLSRAYNIHTYRPFDALRPTTLSRH